MLNRLEEYGGKKMAKKELWTELAASVVREAKGL